VFFFEKNTYQVGVKRKRRDGACRVQLPFEHANHIVITSVVDHVQPLGLVLHCHTLQTDVTDYIQ
jgi:hypothetical protein